MANGQLGSTIRDTIDEAQQHAREIMIMWDSVKVIYTACPDLVIFQSICGTIVKECK